LFFAHLRLSEGKPGIPQDRFCSDVKVEPMPYKSISSYGVVGDLHSAALIGLDGSVDWLCLPRFDSPSVFAGILDEKRGGQFTIGPVSPEARCQQLYQPETNILVTRFLTPDGVAELTDFMPLRLIETEPHSSQLVRRVKSVSGTPSLRLRCAPALNYAQDGHEVVISQGGASFRSPAQSFALAASIPLRKVGDAVEAEFTLKESETLSFIFAAERDGWLKEGAIAEPALEELEEATAVYWQTWLAKSSYRGRWREMVERSALLLQLLTYAPTGAIIAAPSCSLPEWIGGERNWDYRYNWIRDAANTVYALLRIGLFDEAALFMNWIEERCAELAEADSLQTVYSVDGNPDLHERTLAHLEGYRGSRPVRIGNDAFKQLQLDIYGALIDAVYLYNKYGQPVTWRLWKDVRRLVDWVCANWQRPDQGIWEPRGDPRPFVHSKVMCWVAVDRGLRLAQKRSLPADLGRWLKCRNAIYEEVLDQGWNQERRSFVQSYGSTRLDASLLMMPLVFFMAPNDPMMISTVDAICQPLSNGGLVSDGMAYRYTPDHPEDGLPPGEGTFNVCTLWLVEALTRMGRIPQARWLFEKMLSRANHLGLYAEETGPSGEPLGNFPQAYTHMGLISAAYNLNRVLEAPRQPRTC
jgi:GH15 family glucan-1,4-alpha-glucosidase